MYTIPIIKSSINLYFKLKKIILLVKIELNIFIKLLIYILTLYIFGLINIIMLMMMYLTFLIIKVI